MKRIGVVIFLVLMLAGCTGKRDEMDEMMKLRASILGCLECSFDTAVTADYGDSLETFSMNCVADGQGNLSFTVTKPESIQGITGTIREGDGFLTFDDVVLAIPLLADGQITPVSAPWILIKTLRSGYLTACCREDDKIHLTIHDSYADNALQLDIWIDEDQSPVFADITYDNRRILTMEIENFSLR